MNLEDNDERDGRLYRGKENEISESKYMNIWEKRKIH